MEDINNTTPSTHSVYPTCERGDESPRRVHLSDLVLGAHIQDARAVAPNVHRVAQDTRGGRLNQVNDGVACGLYTSAYENYYTVTRASNHSQIILTDCRGNQARHSVH
jgi:hypothetical protein